MIDPKSPLFLERRNYRRRRLTDAARLLPVLGLVLLMVPLLWGQGDAGPATSSAILWIFGVWFLLVLACAALSRWGEHDPAPPLTDLMMTERPDEIYRPAAMAAPADDIGRGR